MSEFDAVVVGAGPNGLVGAITLARAGRRVVLFEAQSTIGGGLRSSELTRPGFVHDVCSAVHPLGVASPALAALPLADYGVEWIHPDLPLAHPLDGGRAALLDRSIVETARGLGDDAPAYRKLYGPFVEHADVITRNLLSPLSVPHAPLTMARFGSVAIRSAQALGRARFRTEEARALFTGSAAHSILGLDRAATAGYGMFLTVLAHSVGWPVVAGGSQRLADALAAILRTAGGEIVTGHEVTSLSALPPAQTVLLDLTPRQVLRVVGERMPARRARALSRFRYGSGVCKLDWALDGPIPWTNAAVSRAATVHLGGTAEEIVAAEAEVAAGRVPDRPYVIVVQASQCDSSRAPRGDTRRGRTATCPTGRRTTAPARSKGSSSGSRRGFGTVCSSAT